MPHFIVVHQGVVSVEQKHCDHRSGNLTKIHFEFVHFAIPLSGSAGKIYMYNRTSSSV